MRIVRIIKNHEDNMRIVRIIKIHKKCKTDKETHKENKVSKKI